MKQQRKTKQRQMILDAVRARCDHPSAEQIYLDIRELDDRISRGTVYRNLNLLTNQGKLLNIKVLSADRFEERLDFHHHLLCTKCGKVSDAPISYDEEVDGKVTAMTGYLIQKHQMVFEGICPECQVSKES